MNDTLIKVHLCISKENKLYTYSSRLLPSVDDLSFRRHLVRSSLLRPYRAPCHKNGIIHVNNNCDNKFAPFRGFRFSGFLPESIVYVNPVFFYMRKKEFLFSLIFCLFFYCNLLWNTHQKRNLAYQWTHVNDIAFEKKIKNMGKKDNYDDYVLCFFCRWTFGI